MAKGAVNIVHYFTEEMMTRYNALISEYNAQNGTSYQTLSSAGLSGAGDAFDEKYSSMLEDYADIVPEGTVNNKCFVWLQGEGDGGRSYIEYKLKMQVLWEHLQNLGFTHFFVLRVGYWGSTGILNVIKAQEDFCAENENCYIVTRAPSLIPHPGATTDNWWISEPDAEYADCRDSYVVPGSSNHHFNEKAMQIFAERSAENIHRILYQGLDPVLEEENIQGLVKEEQKPEEEQPEDTTPYTSFVGTYYFNKGLSVSTSSGRWGEKNSSTAASTDLIQVASGDSVWIQYVFYLSEAHAVGGFYDKDGNLVAPLYYKDFGFSLGGSGGTAAFLTPETTNRISIADVESATGKEIDYVRFTAWQASAGGHTNTEARIYHTYIPTVTAPTCTEEGYTTYTCECGDSYESDYVDALGHTYKNGICTGCGAEQPNLSNYKGKVISILGDSISTFAGYIPVADGFNLEHLARYPDADRIPDVTAVEQTWWMQVINELGAKLGINDSWRGATVSGAAPVTTGTTGENAAMGNLTRIQNLGANGTPDVILFYGGTNDLAHVSKVGTFDAATAPTEVDLATKKWDNLADGYVHTLLRLRHYYPDATIIAMLPTYTKSYYPTDKLAQANAVLAQICDHYGVTYVDLRDCGISADDLPDGIHPGAAGMDYISAAVVETLQKKCEMEAGENVVYSVTHNMNGAESSLGYYKGVTHGKAFVTTITGEDVTVSVTMGDVDITDAVYSNGVIAIEEVTGNIVITAEGRIKTIYEDHLQQLPADICSGTNLWAELEHDKQYYTVSGWGIHNSGTVYSVTFPVSANDRIYATSFGAAGNNGSSIDGIRVTWFDKNGVLESVGADQIYAEFASYGYLTAPQDAVAVNIPMWKISDSNELYILNREHTYENGICTSCGKKLTFEGKKASILSHSMSTYAGISNNTAYNSTIRSNDVYYTAGRHDVYREDTWWQQTIDALGMELLVNNSWSGSCVFMPRKGEASVGYGDRAVNLHNDHTGEEPDVIFVYLGCNDFAYYQDTFGKAADVDYAALIQNDGKGTYAYATPETTCEAYAIMLHKAATRYPDAEIYCITSTARRETDYTGDTYPDAGQPTAYSAELQKVAKHFGYPVVDLEKAIPKEVEVFDKYMGDKRAHANKLGMDQITNAVLSVMLGEETEIRHVLSPDGTVAEQAVLLGGYYCTEVAVPQGYSLVVTMGGQDITAEVYKNGKITITEVTGDITVSTVLKRDSLSFRWEIRNGELTSVGATENAPEKLSGTITDGILSSSQYELETPIVLKHNYPWEIEWKFAGNWRGCVFSSDPVQSTKDMVYLSRTVGGQLCIGTWSGKQYDNYGVDLSQLDDKIHTYRLVNKLSADGNNMVWVYVDGEEIGPMNHYFIGSKDQSKTSDWVSGRDFVFPYISMEGHALKDCKLDYLQVQECAHVYENGICTVCGTEDPSLSNYEGKVISILGDSISTFAGYIPVADGFNLEHLARYPDADRIPDVTAVAQTWWMQVINELGAKLGINDSWRGATVSGAAPVTTGTTGENAAMGNLTRIQNLGANGTPDVILFYGGTNDLAHVSKVGTFDAATAPTEVDLATKKWDNLADGYVHTLLRLRHYYPDATIIAMLPTYTKSYYPTDKLAQANAVLAQICDHYGVTYVDLRDCGISADDLPDGIHPGAAGMDYICAAVVETLQKKCEMEAGENVVHSVTHNMNGAESSLGYYKGVTHGKAFITTITGEDVTVSVTMGDVDITDTVYSNGVIAIEEVTGNIVITAEGRIKTIYEDHLQQLPSDICSGTNLWAELEHDEQYYTANGWGIHNSGTVYSVTFPVIANDRIHATSFGAAGNNGSSIDGIRVTWFDKNGVLESVSADQIYAEFASYGYLTAPQGAVAVNIPMWKISDDNELYILNRDHTYENGICTICGAEDPNTAESLSLHYDDHYDVTGKSVEIIDAGKPTSYQVGYGVAEGTFDTAVVTLDGDTLVATGIGTAQVSIDGQLYEVSVEAAPISLLLLIGQSNMQGIDGNPSESIVCPTGQVYATYADRYKKTVEDVTKFAPSALTGAYSTVNVTGDTVCLENYPVNMLTDAGNGREGMDSGIAYEWVKQTGEKVWTVNVGYGGSSITEWQKGGTHYGSCLDLFSACQETLRKEIEAGHFTLSHMAYFWCQGCADENQTAKWYVDQFLTMHETLKTQMAFDDDNTFEFAGIIPIRSGHNWVSSYRAGVYKDTTNVPYYQSFKDLQFNGPRVAQYWMGNNPELTDIWNVCTIQEGWATLPDGSDGVADYFQSAYTNGIVDYTTQVKQSASWYKPTTPAAVHDNIHYNQIGYNELGREAARNALILLEECDAPEVDATVEFMTWDGFTSTNTITSSTVGNSGTLVVPMVSPVWKAKEVTYAVTEELRYEYYDLIADSVRVEGQLSAQGAEGAVAVSPRALTSYHWNFDGNNLTNDTSNGSGENPLIKLAGSVSDSNFSGVRYQANESIQLLHAERWCVEIQISDWHATSGTMILSSNQTATEGAPYFYFRPKDFFVGIGCYNGSTYDNYGISLKEYDIACSEGTHTYRFINRISDNGSNMVYLIVDDQEIGALTDHYVNSSLTDKGNNWISGKDFAMPYLGTTTAPISSCTVNHITVIETDYDPDIHLHDWSEWVTVTKPGPDGPGLDTRSCSGCGETETREVAGVWQTHDLDEHLVALPDSFCSGVNLWSVLPHDPQYYHSGVKWAQHESGKVYSVTIPVDGGEKIYATSFGKYPDNGNTSGTSGGIRVTFFGANGVLKTMSPADTYAEFASNGGYIVVPEGSVAANIPMYSNSDANELYILNQAHIEEIIPGKVPTATEPGLTEGKKCSACGTILVEQEEVPVLETEGSIEFYMHSLSLLGEIYINHYVKVTGFEGVDIVNKGGLLIWEQQIVDGKPVSMTAEEATFDNCQNNGTVIEKLLTDGKGLYAQSGEGIVARRYADKFYLRVYVEVADGVYAYGPLKEYSVQDYCQNKLNDSKTKQNLKDTCAAMLHYGTAAQKYFSDYKPFGYANANILETYPAVKWDSSLLTPADAVPEISFAATKDIEVYNKSLSLTGAVRCNFYFKPAFSDIQTAELLVWQGSDFSGGLTLENVTFTKKMQQSGEIYAEQSDDIVTRGYDSTIYACAHFVDNDGNDHYSDVIAYSPEQYAANMIANSTNEKLIAVCERIVIFGECAKAYFND